ncbi:hypothetical protein N7450_003843 [Penicillium hetheringtonii]|uniref:Uncharacterized protein n=1 Tax=Penicillium hetheringtonii TaxID=911720 RepID=A0AAD6DNY9_9EURO|nr:hypothetical protein N7450_003843 [Penicillium hetheringtonii]
MWCALSRIRALMFIPDLLAPLWCPKARWHFRRPYENVSVAAASTVADTISESPLWKLAYYIQQFTTKALDESLNKFAKVRDKAALGIRVETCPPLLILQTDTRNTNKTVADIGFVRPVTYRVLGDCPCTCIIVLYTRHASSSSSNEGLEISVTCEKAMKYFIRYPEWGRYFEYLGVDSSDPKDQRIIDLITDDLPHPQAISMETL